MTPSCRESPIRLNKAITHEAAKLATSKIREQTGRGWFIGIQKHQHLNLSMYVQLLLLLFCELAFSPSDSPIRAQDGLCRSRTQIKLKDVEGLIQVEPALTRAYRRKRNEDDCDLFEAWKRDSNIFEALECDSEPGEPADIKPQALRSGSRTWRTVENLPDAFCQTHVV